MGRGCPYCSGKKACEDNSLAKLNPDLAKEWNKEKNGDLTPNHITVGSTKKVWWICSKGHEWQATVNGRNKGIGCPFCSGRNATSETSLAKINPQLSAEWNSERNESLTPNDVTGGSNKLVWWKCEKGHEWQANINSRNNGSGCPYCKNRKVNKDNSLKVMYPLIAGEWNYTKNGNLTPDAVTGGTAKKVWWICSQNHEWIASIEKRVRGNNCPYCSGRYATKENCIATTNPELLREWNYERNSEVKPQNISAKSGKKVWWKCIYCGYEYERRVVDKTRYKGRCPSCKDGI